MRLVNQKTDILSILYDGDVQQCIEKIIHHVKDLKKRVYFLDNNVNEKYFFSSHQV